MKIFLDTNVILDLYFANRPGKQDTLKILEIGNQFMESRTYVSILSVANAHYVLRKSQGKEKALACIHEILAVNKISAMSDYTTYRAMKSLCPDFEDALQIAAAENEACDVIVTNNKKHFADYTALPVYTPEEFIAKCRK